MRVGQPDAYLRRIQFRYAFSPVFYVPIEIVYKTFTAFFFVTDTGEKLIFLKLYGEGIP